MDLHVSIGHFFSCYFNIPHFFPKLDEELIVFDGSAQFALAHPHLPQLSAERFFVWELFCNFIKFFFKVFFGYLEFLPLCFLGNEFVFDERI